MDKRQATQAGDHTVPSQHLEGWISAL